MAEANDSRVIVSVKKKAGGVHCEELFSEGIKLRSSGEIDAALDRFSRGLTKFPSYRDQYGHPAFRKELVRTLVDNGRWEEALALVAKKNSPDRNAWHQMLFARAYSRKGDIPNALAWWSSVSRSQPDHPEVEPWRGKLPRLSEPFDSLAAQVRSFRLDTIFDVGANIGQSSVEFARMFAAASIYAFEPVPAAFHKLEKQTANLNNLTRHNLALGDGNGSVPMSANGDSTMNRVQEVSGGNSVEVPVRRLDQFCSEKGIEAIDFLKIDTEGFDINVLRGCGDFIRNISYIQCEASANEYNQFHNSYSSIYDFLSRAGFYLFLIYGQTHEWGGVGYPVLRRFDAVFINRLVVGDMENVVRK